MVSAIHRALRAALPTACAILLAACAGAGAPAAQPAAPAPAQPGGAAAPTASSAALPAAAAPTAASAAAPAAAQPAPLAPPVTVRIGVLPNISDSGTYIALERGYFQEEGINLELVPFDSAGPQVAPLGAGQLDVGGGSTSAGLYNAIARDVPLKVVADRGSMPPGASWIGLVVRQDLVGEIRDYADLRGRRIAINQFATTNDIAIEAALKRGGLTMQDADIQQIPYSDMNAALANRSIDVAQHNEPFKAIAIEQGLGTFFHGVDEYYPNMQFSVVLFGPQFVKNKPEAARRWMVGFLRGVRDYNDALRKGIRKDETIQLIMKHVPLRDAGLFDKMGFTALNPDGKLNVEGVRNDLQWFVDHGMTQQAPDLSQVIDTSFAEYAVQRLGPYAQ
ncbi:MAG TPA: ABC transporter substrate-binding protein [Chloroflexota bacterium]|nr:ABC transporter substrate-binding protein [Chloroflexota bacterium]